MRYEIGSGRYVCDELVPDLYSKSYDQMVVFVPTEDLGDRYLG
jgi:hypothetical protein